MLCSDRPFHSSPVVGGRKTVYVGTKWYLYGYSRNLNIQIMRIYFEEEDTSENMIYDNIIIYV